jgi:hypothetical protein
VSGTRIPDAAWLAPMVARVSSLSDSLLAEEAELQRLKKESLEGIDRALVEVERARRHLRLVMDQLTEHQHG